MQYYLAPMEGVTTYVYRRAYHEYFHPMDKYFTPFLVPHTKKGFNAREQKEILPENHQGMYLVPQILTNSAEGFLNTVEKLKEYGYKEVNLNLGCPSKTVASKYRGSGFLAKPEELNRFLEEIFSKADVEISIKTRIGKDSPEEFEHILDIYNQYPLKELIIHPRVQQDFYKNHPNLDEFTRGMKESKSPVCYNGDLFTKEQVDVLESRFPDVQTIMLGRGIIFNPGLVNELEEGKPADKDILRQFHDRIYHDYQEISMGDKNVLFKMKEIWGYMGKLFPDSAKALKKIKKAEHFDRYEAAVDEIL